MARQINVHITDFFRPFEKPYPTSTAIETVDIRDKRYLAEGREFNRKIKVLEIYGYDVSIQTNGVAADKLAHMVDMLAAL